MRLTPLFYLTLVVALCYNSAMKVQVNIRMEDDLKKRLEAEAKGEGRSLNNLIVHVLSDYLARRLVKRYWKEKEDARL